MSNILDEKKVPFTHSIGRVMRYIVTEIWSIIISLLLIIINVVSTVVVPRITGYYTDYLKGTTIELQTIITVAVSILVITLIGDICLFIENYILTKAGQRIIYRLRMEVFAHVQSMSQNQFNEMPVGSLVTRVCSYTSQLTEFFTNTVVRIIKNLMTVVIVYIFMFTLSWQLGLILSGVTVLIFLISLFFTKKAREIFAKERRELSEINTFLNETLSGMRIVQIFSKEKKFGDDFRKMNHNYFKTKYSVTIAFSIYRPLLSLINILSVALIIFSGVKFGLTAGTIVSFYFFLNYFFEPIQALADELNQISKAITSVEKLFALLDIEPEVIDKEDAIEIEHFNGKIEFRNVWFAYVGEEYVLKDVSFVINPRESIAFVGATGSGKTTILGLIVKNFEPQKGDIFIDDINIKDIKTSSLRKAVGQMMQDVFLFSGSIKDNLTLFDDSFALEEIDSAAEYVNAKGFIDELPDKYEAKVIERGENFSSGQRQLLSFARTVLHKPEIIILDEATANIDTESEVKIQEALTKMRNIGTMLVVAHRLSTIQHSDKIFVLSHGEIIESGNHQSLIKAKGYYYNLYKLQFEEN